MRWLLSYGWGRVADVDGWRAACFGCWGMMGGGAEGGWGDGEVGSLSVGGAETFAGPTPEPFSFCRVLSAFLLCE